MISAKQLSGLALIVLGTGAISAQQPTPPLMVVQAANDPVAAPAATTTKPVPAEENPSIQTAMKALQQTKAANDETLKRQQATLQQLDELAKAVEQLKIFAKRG